jgi:glyoxylase-like metal-dependent hydrolase (beta-lactamase superfamily II)
VVARWLRQGLWRPFEVVCRRSPLVPFRVAVTEPVADVRLVRIDNAVTRAIGRVGGGYDYSVSYLVGDELLVDTGFPWAARPLRRTLSELGVAAQLTHVVNTHSHEDHVGNNDVIAQLGSAQILIHSTGVPTVRWPAQVPWYRGFMFGPLTGSRVAALGSRLQAGAFCFEVIATPGHTRDHVCLFEPERGWLFAGDLYVDDRLDAQLPDVDGPQWITSLERATALDAQVLLDGHGLVIHGRSAVREALDRKRTFLEAVRDRTRREAPRATTLPELTRRVFTAAGPLDRLSRREGRLSLLTGSNFSRSHLVASFLPTDTPCTHGSSVSRP